MKSSRVAGLVAVVSLVACQGKDSSPSDVRTDPSAPVANAGRDQTVFRGSPVTLDGRASTGRSGAALTFRWSQTAGPTVALSDDRIASPSFVAPRASGALRFSLAVSDGTSTSAPDEVVVLVQNRAPSADAGPDQVVAVGHVVTLDPAGSADPDGDPLTATWYQRGGPAVALQAHPDGSVSFVAPATPAVLDFSLVTTDGEAVSPESPVRVQVVDQAANWPPVVQAGPDLDVPRRSVVGLSASAQDREGDPLTWTWLQTAGPSVSLLGANGPTPSFVAPAIDADLEFEVVVADALATGADRVVVHVRNQAPVVRALTLSPAAPVRSDAIAASATIFDADQDPLTVTWEWTRNGSLIPDAVTSTLAARSAVRGDVVAVTVRASDGFHEATARASVTIQDAPATLTVAAADTVTWGQPFTFTVTASDPDGDAVGTAVLRRGPAGMTLSPSGEGTWTPTLPMFDRALDVTFEVGLASSAATPVERTVRVVDPARAYPLRRTDLQIPVGQSGLVAIDPDGDGTSTLLVAGASGVYELARAPGGYAQAWSYPFAVEGLSPTALAAADVDGDRLPEIFVALSSWPTPGGVLLKLDGAERREAARASLSCLDLKLADLDRDGTLELVCLAGSGSYGATQRVVVLDPVTLGVKWQTGDLALGTHLAVGNVDQDPALEIVTSAGYVFDGATHANEWAYSGGFGDVVGTGDLNGDGVEEIVGADAWSRFRVFDAVLKTPLLEHANFDTDALLVADLDGDRRAEIVVGDGQWGNVTAYRYRPATNDLVTLFAMNSQEHGVTSLVVADLDGDGAPELAWGSGATSSGRDVLVVAGVSPAGIEWTSVTQPQLDGPFVGAALARISAGGPPRLMFEVPRTNSGYAGARLVAMDASGVVTISAEVGTNWSENAGLATADVDADGVDEVLLASASLYDGYLTAWDFAAGTAAWTSPARIGSGRAVVAADLNGDLAPDLVAITAEGNVLAYDLVGSALLFQSTSLGTGVNVSVADLDHDGTPEIVALSTSRLVVFRRTTGPVGFVEAASVALPDGGTDLAVADCDGDGVPEIYVLSGTWYGSSFAVLRFDASLAPLGSFSVRGVASALFVEDLGFPRKNLVLAKGGGSAPTPQDALLEAVDAVSGGRIWQSPPLAGMLQRNSLRYVDLDANGYRELAFGTASGMFLTR